MVFWGIEVKPGEPYNHTFEKTRSGGKLHISQATLGIGSAAQRSVVQYEVGDQSPRPLCSLLPDEIESCSLHLQFDALDDEVIFSVLGPTSVHLAGFYDDSGPDSWPRTFFDEMKKDFKEDDSVKDDDTEMFLPSRQPPSNSEEEKEKKNKKNKKNKKKAAEEKSDTKIQSESEKKEEDAKAEKAWVEMFFAEMNIIKDDDPVKDDDTEMFFLPRSNSGEEKKAAEEKSDKKIQTESKKKEEDGVHNGAGIKRKIDSITQDGEAERASEKSEDSSKPSTEIGQEKSRKTKKKKKVQA